MLGIVMRSVSFVTNPILFLLIIAVVTVVGSLLGVVLIPAITFFPFGLLALVLFLLKPMAALAYLMVGCIVAAPTTAIVLPLAYRFVTKRFLAPIGALSGLLSCFAWIKLTPSMHPLDGGGVVLLSLPFVICGFCCGMLFSFGTELVFGRPPRHP